jgi:hypothetical protein
MAAGRAAAARANAALITGASAQQALGGGA